MISQDGIVGRLDSLGSKVGGSFLKGDFLKGRSPVMMIHDLRSLHIWKTVRHKHTATAYS